MGICHRECTVTAIVLVHYLCSVEENMRFADTRADTLQGYFLASFLFMAIVFSLPICLGLAALALDLPVSTLIILYIPYSAKSILHTPSNPQIRCLAADILWQPSSLPCLEIWEFLHRVNESPANCRSSLT